MTPDALARVLMHQRDLLPVAEERDGARRVAERHLCLSCGASAGHATHLVVSGEVNRWVDLCQLCALGLHLHIMVSGGVIASPNH